MLMKAGGVLPHWMDEDAIEWKHRIERGFDQILKPAAKEATTAYDFKSIIRDLYAEGISGLRFVDERDGLKAGLPAQAAFADALGTVPCGALGMSLTIHYDMVAPMIYEKGESIQLREILDHAVRGRLLFSHAVSEPNAGSDVRQLATRAEKVGGRWIINGVKSMISLAPVADYHFIVATIEGRQAPFNMVAFLVPAHASGVTVGSVQPTLGNQLCPVADIEFENVKVDDNLRIGQVGMGFILQMEQFVQERILSSLRANRMASTCLETLLQHLKNREVNGQPLGEIDSIRHRVAKLVAEHQNSEAVAYKAMDMWLSGQRYETLSASSKFLSSRLVKEVSREALQLGGVMHYQNDSPLAKCFRDARLFSISTGSDEMMLKSIAASEKY